MCNKPRGAVLVVEDEPIIRLDAVCMLQEAGFAVLEAEDSLQALEVVDANPCVGLLFSDINMPGAMDGLSLAREVHERRPGVQFILTSGRVHPTREQIPDDGVYLPKPYSHDQVVALIRRLMP